MHDGIIVGLMAQTPSSGGGIVIDEYPGVNYSHVKRSTKKLVKKRVKKTQSSQSTLNKFIFGYTPLEDAAIKLDEAFKTPIEDSVEITEL